MTSPVPSTAIYRFLRTGVEAFFRLTLQIEVEGVENVPSEGPVLLLPNHQSILDPMLVQAFFPRPVHSMTKSTQFSSPLFRWLIPRILGFPTRRYRVDPQTVRVVLQRLDAGEVVGIYAEGERSWDAELQPFRRGTIRLLLKAGVPVIPCGITGSYDVWPRWSRRPKRRPVRIRYGKPLHFGRHDTREARDRLLPEASASLERALRQLMMPDATTGEGGGPIARKSALPSSIHDERILEPIRTTGEE